MTLLQNKNTPGIRYTTNPQQGKTPLGESYSKTELDYHNNNISTDNISHIQQLFAGNNY